MKKRLFFTLCTFTAAVFLPWYVVAGMLAVGFFLFAPYYEGLFVAVMYESLYAPIGTSAAMWWSLVAISLFLIFYFIKPLMRNYA